MCTCHIGVKQEAVTLSPTLTYLISSASLILPFTSSFIISTLLFIIQLLILISSSSLLLASLQCGVSALKFELEVLIVDRFVCVVLFTKQGFFGRRLRCTFFSFVSGLFFSVQFFNFSFNLLPQLIFNDRIYQKTPST